MKNRLPRQLAQLTLILRFGILLPLAGVAATAAETTRGLWTKGWFWEASAGISIVPGGDVTLGNVTYEGDFSNGLLFKGAVGKAWNANWTTSLEWFYRSNSVDQLVSSSGTITDGDLASNNFFLTTTYALDERWSWRGIRPYAGLGLGVVQEVDLDLIGLVNEEFSVSGEFAFQWLVGLQRRLGRSGLIFLEGRAIAADELKMNSSSSARFVKVQYETWSMLAGLRFSF